MAYPNTPKLAVPFRLNHTAKRAVVVEQDSLEEVEQCVVALLRTPLGWRPENPEFGVADQAFGEGGADLNEIQNAIAQHEPRAEIHIDRDPTILTSMVDEVNVRVRKGELNG